MRFNRKNWIKFFDGSNKKTTLRLKKSRIGHHKAYAGSYYHPELLGEFDIKAVHEVKYKDLGIAHAINDGFNYFEELQTELIMINGKIDDETILYQHWIENARDWIKSKGENP